MKILIASDSHQKSQVWMDALKKKYPDMDLYLHAGDLDDIPTNGWKVVAGNVDRKANRKFPCQQIIERSVRHRCIWTFPYAATRKKGRDLIFESWFFDPPQK